MTISIITCPNGFGHFYRLIDIAYHLSKSYKVNLICTKEQLRKINNNKYKKINFIVILKQIIINQKNSSFLYDFYCKDLEKIEEIKTSSLIISDNLINKIYVKKKFILLSNFFWGKVFNLKTVKFKKYQKIEDNFLRNNEIFQNKYFGLKNNKIKKTIKINFTGEKKKIGLSSAVNYNNKSIFFYNKNQNKFPGEIIKKLQNKYKIVSNYPIKKMNIKYYNKDRGLNNFSFIISRPGLGSITDSIRYNVPLIYYFQNEKNNEMEKNIILIKRYEIGLPVSIKSNTIDRIVKLELSGYKRLFNNLKKFKFNGEKKILNYVGKTIK